MTVVPRDAGDTPSQPRSAPVVGISPGFIEALGARAAAGRLFNTSDVEGSPPPIAIVDQPFVAKFLVAPARWARLRWSCR